MPGTSGRCSGRRCRCRDVGVDAGDVGVVGQRAVARVRDHLHEALERQGGVSFQAPCSPPPCPLAWTLVGLDTSSGTPPSVLRQCAGHLVVREEVGGARRDKRVVPAKLPVADTRRSGSGAWGPRPRAEVGEDGIDVSVEVRESGVEASPFWSTVSVSRGTSVSMTSVSPRTGRRRRCR